jgi:hypothetical protein
MTITNVSPATTIKADLSVVPARIPNHIGHLDSMPDSGESPLPFDETVSFSSSVVSAMVAALLRDGSNGRSRGVTDAPGL